MDMIEEFPSEFFKAEELKGKPPVKLTIERVEKKEMNDGAMKPVCYFKEDSRGLVLNVTNRGELIDRFGRNSDSWIGEEIAIVAQRVTGPSGSTHGIRLAPRAVSETADDEIPFDDAIPFGEKDADGEKEPSSAGGKFE